jgi:hypothetical protein
MARAIVFQILGFLLTLLSILFCFFNLAMDSLSFFTSLVCICGYLAGVALLVFPSGGKKRVAYFLTFISSNLIFVATLYALDIARTYGIKLALFFEIGVSIFLAASFAIILMSYISKKAVGKKV